MAMALKPTDVIVIEVPMPISDQEMQRLKADAETQWPQHEIVIINAESLRAFKEKHQTKFQAIGTLPVKPLP